MNSTKNREKNDATTTTTTIFELIINDHEKFKGEREREDQHSFGKRFE